MRIQEFAGRLRSELVRARAVRDWSLEELARRSGITMESCCDLEDFPDEAETLTIPQVAAVMRELGVSTERVSGVVPRPDADGPRALGRLLCARLEAKGLDAGAARELCGWDLSDLRENPERWLAGSSLQTLWDLGALLDIDPCALRIESLAPASH